MYAIHTATSRVENLAQVSSCQLKFVHADCHYAECRYEEFHDAECHFSDFHYAEWRYPKCHYAFSRGAIGRENSGSKMTLSDT